MIPAKSAGEEIRPSQSLRQVAPTSRARERILVVEDDHDCAAYLEAVLAGAGFETTVAHDGEEALRLLREEKPALVTLDIRLPGESGLLFYRQARSQRTYRQTPVIVLTGLTRGDPEMRMIIGRFLEVEQLPLPEAFLQKPVAPGDLLGIVEEVLRKKHACASDDPSRGS
ncbi:MAG: response regulator [Planctomycetota bacterium]